MFVKRIIYFPDTVEVEGCVFEHRAESRDSDHAVSITEDCNCAREVKQLLLCL